MSSERGNHRKATTPFPQHIAKHVHLLEERGFIVTERTSIITRRGIKKNGNLLYTIVPMYEVMERFYERQFTTLDSTAERLRVQSILSAQQGA